MLDNFFRHVVELTGPFDGKLVLVTHVVPDRPRFLSALRQVAPIAAIIPKPASIHEPTLAALRSSYNVVQEKRAFWENAAHAVTRLRPLVGDDRFVILDMGGYFATVLEDLAESFPNLVGIVEDTENGHKRYERRQPLPRPVISVARSPLKEPEDHLVGHSIVFSADRALRKHNEIMGGMAALVLGYGKVGRSIADGLRARGVTVSVYDTDPIRRAWALSHGYQIPERPDALRLADLIFCATGNRSLTTYDLDYLKRRVFIFSATSSDDELLFQDDPAGYTRVPIRDTPATLFLKPGREVFLVNDGNAVNFLDGAVVGGFIFLVQSELIYSIKALPGFSGSKQVRSLPYEERKQLAEAWIRYTYSYSAGLP